MATEVGNWGGGRIWRITTGIFSSNTYFCEVPAAQGGFLVDPGLDGDAIEAGLRTHGFRPQHVFCTHGHFDHAGSASFFQERYGCQVFMHKADERILKASNFLLMAFKIPKRIILPKVTYVDNGFTLDLQGELLTYLPAAGHTPGSCVLEFGRAWFTGDTIYSRRVGLSALPGEDIEALKRSIRGLWDRLLAERLVYPGHGEAADGASIRAKNRELLNFLDLPVSDTESS